MSYFQALILGLVQGLAEFLPISSSGHLKLAEHYLGLPVSDDLVAFDVLLHVATLLAILIYFRADLKEVGGAFARSLPRVLRRDGWARVEADAPAKWGWLVAVTMVPTAIVAITLQDTFAAISTNIAVVSLMLMVTGLLNYNGDLAARRPGSGRRIEQLTISDALVIGLAQSVALIHGISRSGSTIAAGLSRGLDQDAAPRFAFLMAIPAIAGAAVVKLPDLRSAEGIPFGPALLGFVLAGVSGYWALTTIFRVVREGRLKYFAWYCWLVGGISFLLTIAGR